MHLLYLTSTTLHHLFSCCYLTWCRSGVLNMGNLSEASDQALLIELDRALQLITAQQQFLIEQVGNVAAPYCCSVLMMIESWGKSNNL